MNLLTIAEVILATVAAYAAVEHGGPALWRFATKKTPKLADEARLIFSDVETAAERVVSEVKPAAEAAEAAAAPVVTELEEAAAGLVAQVKGYLAAKDAEIADLAAKTQAATAQRTGLAGELQGLIG